MAEILFCTFLPKDKIQAIEINGGRQLDVLSRKTFMKIKARTTFGNDNY